MPVIVMRYLLRIVISQSTLAGFFGETEGYHLTGQVLCDFTVIRNVSVDNQTAVRRQQSGKFMEGMAYVIQILEKVQMVSFDI